MRVTLMLRVALALVVLCGTARAMERARPMGLYPAGGAPALAMLDSRVDVTVRGPILETVVVQRFRNTTGHATEATYIFPLPPDAAVSAMQLRIGARTIRGSIDRRDAAQRAYEAAVAAGQGAALLEQERPDVFTQSIAAIPANGVVEVVLRYDSLARFEAGSWQLVLPMVVAPRYVPGTASGRGTAGSGRAPDTDRAPDASRVTPAASPGAGGSTAVTVHFTDEPSDLRSPTHELGGTRKDASFSDPHSDHDAIVRWRAAPTAGWVEREGDGGYAAVVVEAPPPAKAGAVRFVLALDRAATTRGDGDAVERPLVRALLSALDRASRARVGDTWAAPADALASLERTWSTPVAVFDATRTFAALRPEGAPVVLISDGLIADDAAALAAARKLGVPVHVIGVGSAPARAFLTQLAAATGGTVRFAIPGDDLAALALGLTSDLASRPAPLQIHWGTLGALEVEPVVLPRLGAGQAMLAVARIQRAQSANLRTRGDLVAFAALSPARAVDGAVTTHGPLARRWARERLGDLLAGPHDRAAVERLALAYGLVSPYTSLIAVGSDVVVQGGVKHSVAVPVSLPSGMQWHAVQQALDVASKADEPLARDANQLRREQDRSKDRSDTSQLDTLAGTGAPPTNKPSDAPRAGDNRGPAPTTPAKPAPPKQPPAAQPAPVRTHAPEPPRPPAGRAADVDDDAAEAKPKKKQQEPELSDEELAKLAEQESKEEVITVTGSTIDRKTLTTPAPLTILSRSDAGDESEAVLISASGRRVRFAAALAGGLVLDHGTHALAAVSAHLTLMRPLRPGLDAALWLVDGGDTQGRVQLGLSHAVSRHVDLSFGAGIHFGSGTGPAASLQLAIPTLFPWLTPYLRYDAAVLFSGPSTDVTHAFLLGLELSY